MSRKILLAAILFITLLFGHYVDFCGEYMIFEQFIAMMVLLIILFVLLNASHDMEEIDPKYKLKLSGIHMAYAFGMLAMLMIFYILVPIWNETPPFGLLTSELGEFICKIMYGIKAAVVFSLILLIVKFGRYDSNYFSGIIHGIGFMVTIDGYINVQHLYSFRPEYINSNFYLYLATVMMTVLYYLVDRDNKCIGASEKAD